MTRSVRERDKAARRLFSMGVCIVAGLLQSCAVPSSSIVEKSFQELADEARQALREEWPAIRPLSDSESRAREELIAKFRYGYGSEAYSALAALTQDGESFLRNCVELLDILRERGMNDVPGGGRFGSYWSIASRIQELPEGIYKDAIVETFFAFRRRATLSGVEASRFDSAMFYALYRYPVLPVLLPEYGDWSLILALSEGLDSDEEWIRITADANLQVIAFADVSKYKKIRAILRKKGEVGEKGIERPVSEYVPDPAFVGIPARVFQQFPDLSAEELKRQLVAMGRPEAQQRWMIEKFSKAEEPVTFSERLEKFLNRPDGPDFLESYVRRYLRESDLTALHALLEDEDAVLSWHSVIFAVSALEEDSKAFETVKKFVGTPRTWEASGYLEQEARYRNRSIVSAICALAMVDPALSGPFLKESFSQDGAYRFLQRWGDATLPGEMSLERPLITDFLYGAAGAMLHSQSRELFSVVEETFKTLASKSKEERTEFESEFLWLCVDSMAVRDLYLDLGWDPGVAYLNSVDSEKCIAIIGSYRMLYLKQIKQSP